MGVSSMGRCCPFTAWLDAHPEWRAKQGCFAAQWAVNVSYNGLPWTASADRRSYGQGSTAALGGRRLDRIRGEQRDARAKREVGREAEVIPADNGRIRSLQRLLSDQVDLYQPGTGVPRLTGLSVVAWAVNRVRHLLRSRRGPSDPGGVLGTTLIALGVRVATE